jgi:hypothetical protein
MNSVQIWLAKIAIKLGEAIFKKQYGKSKPKVEDADKTNTPVADKPDSDRV